MRLKKTPSLLYIIFVGISLSGCVTSNVEQAALKNDVETSAKPSVSLIFDTDMAIDDWLALLFLERSEDINLLAVTVPGSGESHCEPAERNVLSLLELANPASITPVACGDEWPLEGYFVFPEAWQVDSDTLSGVTIPYSQRTAYDGHAIELIHEKIMESNEPVTILATGSMTNLAQWLDKYPEDKAKVNRVVLMGGAVDVPGNIIVPGFTDNNPNKHAEWNFYIDPLATKMVLESGLPIELVGLDVTNQVLVTTEFAEYFKKVADNPAAYFWDKVLDANDWFIDSNEYYFWDVLAALVVADKNSFCRGELASLTSENSITDEPWLPTSDLAIPTLNWKGLPRQHIDAETAGVVSIIDGAPVNEKNSLICRQTNGKLAFDKLVDVMTDSDDLPVQPEYRKPLHD